MKIPVLKWQTMDSCPDSEDRILIFSYCYKKGNPMRIRIVDAQFAKICNDATHWAYIPEPIINN